MAAAALVEDLVEEILLRLPPSDPACLVRAALVCKGWCRLVSGASFRRRFREFHRTPPMLGVLCNLMDGGLYPVRFAPTSSSWQRRDSFHPRRVGAAASADPTSGWQVLDARHGRVLLLDTFPYPYGRIMPGRMVVWDPITDEQVELPMVPLDPYPYHWGCNAAVFCAVADSDDDGGCSCNRRRPFRVVFVGSMGPRRRAFARVYSSDAGAWGETIISNITHESLMPKPSTLAGNALHFRFYSCWILKYGLSTRKLSQIHPPDTSSDRQHGGVLTANEDGVLGFAQVLGSRLYLWSRDEVAAGWTQNKVIELETLLPTKALSASSPHVLGFAADGVGIIFLGTNGGIFAVCLKSSQVMKEFWVDNSRSTTINNVVPYVTCFYTPDFNRHICLG